MDDFMSHSSTFLLPSEKNQPSSQTDALVILNQRLPRFAPLLWEHGTFWSMDSDFVWFCKVFFYSQLRFCVSQHRCEFALMEVPTASMMKCLCSCPMKMLLMFEPGSPLTRRISLVIEFSCPAKWYLRHFYVLSLEFVSCEFLESFQVYVGVRSCYLVSCLCAMPGFRNFIHLFISSCFSTSVRDLRTVPYFRGCKFETVCFFLLSMVHSRCRIVGYMFYFSNGVKLWRLVIRLTNT